MIPKINWPAWPQYGLEEQEAVSKVIQSNQIFADREVKKFEEDYSSFMGCKYSLGLGNATQGLHLALAALNIGIGDEVIVTPYSWISTASCILMQNAIPIFCDIEKESFGLDPNEIERKISKKTKAIIVVHMFGYPAKIKEISSIASKHGIPLIEDTSHAHGAKVDDTFVGNFGSIAVFSLHQRKSLSVGDGGIVCTNQEEIYNKIRRLRSFGDPELSYNYRMTEFAGALGQVGLKKLDRQNRVRSTNAQTLFELLKDQETLKIHLGRSNEVSVFYAILIEILKPIQDLDKKLKNLQDLGIPIRKTWEPLHIHPHFNPREAEPPARGLPWKFPEYDGIMKNMNYSTLDLPVTNQYCPNNLLELYVHPPTGIEEITFAASRIRELLIS